MCRRDGAQVPGVPKGGACQRHGEGQAQRCQRTVLGNGTTVHQTKSDPPPTQPLPIPPPPAQNSTVLVRAECGAAWEGRQGAEAAVVSRGTTVPLSRSKVVYAERRWVHEGWWATQCHVFCVLPCVWVEMSCGVGIWGGEELCQCAGGGCREG